MHHLSMPSATWQDERSASMRYIAKSYLMLGDPQQARNWYFRAIAEAPHLREPYMDFAQLLYETQDWDGVLYFTECALSITQRPRSYICEAAPWGSRRTICAVWLFTTPDVRFRPWKKPVLPWRWNLKIPGCKEM